MKIEKLAFQLGNVVMLYEGLEKARVSRDDLYGLFDGVESSHFDAGPVLIVRYEQKKIDILIFLQENRVEVKITNPNDDEWEILSNTAAQVYDAIDGAKLKAYGYNYFADVHLKGAEDAAMFLLEQFKSSLEPVEKQLDSKISTISMTLKYAKDGVQRQFILAPKPDEKTLAVQLNVHYESDHLDAGKFNADYIKQKEYFTSIVDKIFN